MKSSNIDRKTPQSEIIQEVIRTADELFSTGRIFDALEKYHSSKNLVEDSNIPNSDKSLFYANFGKIIVNNIFMNSIPVSEAVDTLEVAKSFVDHQDLTTLSLIIDQMGLAEYYDNLFKENPNYVKAENLFVEALNIRQSLNDQ
ncbi:MAG: hypothetical protein ACW99Q_27525, partial [Candidatus Kariarchaeaceae archaeon]